MFTSSFSLLDLLERMALSNPNMLYALGFMVFSAGLLVWIGAKRSVVFAASGKSEMMNSSDAMKFPLTGSCVLFGLYLAIKFIPKEVLAMLLACYLTFISVITLSSFFRPYFGANVPLGLLCCAVGGAFFYTHHWVLNNVLAFGICIVGIEAMQLKTYTTSAILLVGLFFYDVFWVFGTDVMVTVAKNIQGPIKLLFPQDIFGDHEKKSLLGLGDIVIPGFFISQMLRFALLQYQRKNQGVVAPSLEAIAKSFNIFSFRQCSYFHVAFVAYICSLLNTMAVMVFFDAAQPALLYIVPWLLVCTFLAAAVRGEVKDLITFDEESQDAAEARKKEEEEAKKKKKEDTESGSKETMIQSLIGGFSELGTLLAQSVLFIFGLEKKDDEKKDGAAVQNGSQNRKSNRSASPLTKKTQ